MTAAETMRLPLPRWVYTPGGALPPDEAVLAHAKALVPQRFDRCVPQDHPALAYALALNDAGFFWEAHEILEAVWRAAPQGGRDRILLRACIQIANAGLKHRLGRLRAVARLLAEAQAELDELALRENTPHGAGFADGYPVAKLRQRLALMIAAAGPGTGWMTLGPDQDMMQKNASF